VVNIALKLDRLERLAHELLSRKEGPIYLKEGSELPADVDPDRVTWIKRVLLDPADHPDEALPEITEASPAIEKPQPTDFHRKLEVAETGIV
jgi:hypothetical protein